MGYFLCTQLDGHGSCWSKGVPGFDLFLFCTDLCLILHKTSRKGKEFISGQPHFIELSSDVMDVLDMVSLMFRWILLISSKSLWSVLVLPTTTMKMSSKTRFNIFTNVTLF